MCNVHATRFYQSGLASKFNTDCIVRALTHVGKNFTSSSNSEEIENKHILEKSDLTLCNAVMVGKTLMSALSA